MQNQVKIIGGQWRSRIIYFPKLPQLRPTPGRLRETLFNWLGQNLDGKVCLDLFAGSGALGFEALSRGAKEVVMVESNRSAHASLTENSRRLGAQNLQIYAQDAKQFLTTNSKRYDIIFLDPPFTTMDSPALIDQVTPHLLDGGLVYLESGQCYEQFLGYTMLRQKSMGKVNAYLIGQTDA